METPEEKSAASVKMVDAVTAIVIFLLGALVMWDSWRLGERRETLQERSDGRREALFPSEGASTSS